MRRVALAVAPAPSAVVPLCVVGGLLRMKIKLAVFRLLALAAMGVCMAMLLDYLLPSPAFCGFTAGCEEVTHSAYGRPLGIPLPLWGLGAFGAFCGLTLCPGGRLGRLIGPAAVLAGLGGLSFILLQLLVIRRVCPLCMVIDAAALFITATELLAAPRTTAPVLFATSHAINCSRNPSDSASPTTSCRRSWSIASGGFTGWWWVEMPWAWKRRVICADWRSRGP